MCSVSSEIAAIVAENIIDKMKAPIVRITLPEAPAPASRALEKLYYPNHKTIIESVRNMMKR